jgi:hypothetical protein
MISRIIILVLSFLACSTTLCREIRTPLPTRYGPFYKLFPYDKEHAEHRSTQVWATYFNRHAEHALCKQPSCYISGTCSLSNLIFGKACFSAADTVANNSPVFTGDGTNRQLKVNPFINPSIFCPNITFKDQGLMLGMYAWHHIDSKLRVGVRVTLPVRSFKTKVKPSCIADEGPLGCPDLHNVLVQGQQDIGGNTVRTYGYRLDFLSMLPRYCTLFPANQFPVVNYHDSSFIGQPITISNQDVTDNPLLQMSDQNPVTVVNIPVGSVPSQPLAVPIATAQSLPPLPSSGITVTPQARFVIGNDYTALGNNQSAQEELWVVPTADATGLVPPAQIVQDNIDALLCCLTGCSDCLIERCGTSLAGSSLHGLSDLDTDFLIQYQPYRWMYAQGCFGVRWPTGKRVNNARHPYAQPLGNNGHVELKVGGRVSFSPCAYFILNTDYYFSHVLHAEEQVAAPFVQATVKNIGPCVPANISWNYFLSHFDALFALCTQPYIGIDVGYVFYAKSHDRVRLKTCHATDCSGNIQPLNAALLEAKTKIIMHKIRTELVYDTRDYFTTIELGFFGGYSFVFGGMNVPQDKEIHVGCTVLF